MMNFALPALSFVLPVYNAEATIGSSLSALNEFLSRNRIHGEVIVVDDASRDRSAARAEARADDFISLRVLRCDRRGGPGRAIRLGMLIASGERRIYSYPATTARPNDLAELDLDEATAPDVAVTGGLTVVSARAADAVFPRCRLDGRGFDIEVLTIARSLGFSVDGHDSVSAERLSAIDRLRVRSRLRDLSRATLSPS